ncbi:hypothetical protein BGW36DRAFT_393742 [Talaromyces proteolyticus]|uniref:Fumarylacetoacetase-like C-terminal domain-containing protein n=1 Tax=Talaromyces proteolyticus TaxID=1131652 RepID=A0AAD4KZC0_9EURO|nr:uncharacterized protein BGW36DRAFT_393742 [Talaromyces proteolyticus]KAH8703388.1 hypothetical protein BGW36DRAFT_393742 [Talaromyces proteolyticus]
MSHTVPWTHLIRFVSEHDDCVYFGDAILPADDYSIGAEDGSGVELKARLIHGNPFDRDCKVREDSIVKVKQLLGPLTPDTVPAIRCIGLNYADHASEVSVAPVKHPAMFPKTPNTIAGHGSIVEIPKIAQDNQADYEGELVVVISHDCKNATEDTAMTYVLGYAVADDVSARKWQNDPKIWGISSPPQASFSKSFDGFCPIGPCIVSSQCLKNPHDLTLTTKVNGEIRQSSSTSHFIFTIPRLIAFLSQGTTLQKGSVILTGTPAGVGSRMKPPQYLKPGDKIEITISKIGTLIHGVSFAE